MSDSFDGLGRKRKTHCKHGHPFDGTEKWSVNWRGYRCRVCRECARQRMARKRAKPDFLAREAASTARWRARNPEHANKLWRDNRREKKAWIDSQKVKCERCGETHIACLEFHHRNPEDKEFLISVSVAKCSLERIKAEVAKCEVICSNCHRKHHWEEKHKREE